MPAKSKETYESYDVQYWTEMYKYYNCLRASKKGCLPPDRKKYKPETLLLVCDRYREILDPTATPLQRTRVKLGLSKTGAAKLFKICKNRYFMFEKDDALATQGGITSRRLEHLFKQAAKNE